MIKNMRFLWAFLARDAAISVSYRLDFILFVISITLQVVVLYFASLLIGQNEAFNHYGGYLPFATVGLAVLSFFNTSFSSFSQAIRKEQVSGTLESTLVTPVPIPIIVIGSTLWSIVWAAIAASLYIACSSFLFGFDVKGSLIGAALLIILLTLFVASLGILSASFTIVFKKGDPLGFLIGSLSAVLGGAFFPVEMLPPWVQKISYIHPFTYGLAGLRAILLEGQPIQSVLPEFTALLAGTSLLIPLSFYCFRLALRYARREGTLLHY